MAVKSFKDLRVYSLAFDTAMEIFQLSTSWPKEERYALTDQIRRSSRSVCANLSEAWRKRRYERHFISKLSDANAEAAETRVWLQFALSCNYLKPQRFEKMDGIYNNKNGGLVKMMNNPAQWCSSSRSVDEPIVRYILKTDYIT